MVALRVSCPVPAGCLLVYSCVYVVSELMESPHNPVGQLAILLVFSLLEIMRSRLLYCGQSCCVVYKHCDLSDY